MHKKLAGLLAVVGFALLATMTVALPGSASTMNGTAATVSPDVSISRATVIARAKVWVAAGIKYNQGATYKGYRTDCSGYVSYTWELGKPGLTTPEFPSVATQISKSSLKAGDILLNKAAGNAGHVVLFDTWANGAHTEYWGYELSGSGMHHRIITYPYYSGYGTFLPYRYKHITG